MTTRQHEANEWADMATNGIQWLRNIREGINTVDEALAGMEEQLRHCQAVSAEAAAHEANQA